MLDLCMGEGVGGGGVIIAFLDRISPLMDIKYFNNYDLWTHKFSTNTINKDTVFTFIIKHPRWE